MRGVYSMPLDDSSGSPPRLVWMNSEGPLGVAWEASGGSLGIHNHSKSFRGRFFDSWMNLMNGGQFRLVNMQVAET